MAVIPWSSEKFPPVGRCIYAREGEEHTGPFTDEHIIPFGLLPKGGDWFLPKSSCLACNAITKKFEDTCLRATMGVFRAKLELKTRRKKKRAEPQKVVFIRPDGSTYIKHMGHVELPHFCIGFDWATPGILRDQPSGSRDFDGKVIVRYPQGELEKFIADQYGLRLGSANMLDFARMLAKIGHSYAFAKCGIDTFKPMLLDFILGRTENASYLVGGDGSGPPPDQPHSLHDIFPVACRVEPSGAEYLLIAIRLFAFIGMPRYHVVVGKKLKELALPKQQLANR
jgi:hypothetical protein